MFETDEGDEVTLWEKRRRWVKRERDWELRSRNGKYRNTSFTLGA